MNPAIAIQKNKDTYGSKLVFVIIMLFALMTMIMYKIQHNQPKVENNGFIPLNHEKTVIYLMRSKTSALFYTKNGIAPEQYTKKLNRFVSYLKSLHYDVKMISEKELSTLPKDGILFLIDAPALHDKIKSNIIQFVKNGGKLFFNFTTGFSNAKGKYEGEKFITDITGLKISKHAGFATFKDSGGLFITPKLLSPFSKYLHDGKLLNVVLYDKIPFYISTDNLLPDIYATSYPQITPPVTKNRADNFTTQESGVAWHGYLGKGKWVYTSMPSYSFYDIKEQKDDFKKILAAMIDYLKDPVYTQKYPYIDRKSMIFISEDTEYKFSNFQRFADLSKEYSIPVTAFIVASLADKPQNQKMMHDIAKNPWVEFGSHSTTHNKIVGESEAYIINETTHSKEIIDKYSSKPIQGFRPPREELNELMKKHLLSSGFNYILGESQSYLYPKFDRKNPNLLILPRHGTDDYSYLVNLDWSQSQIVDEIIKESEFVTLLNGIFTLSVHTHLFTYGTNINILRKYYTYLQNHPKLHPLNGSEVYNKIKFANHITQCSKMVNNQLIITVNNQNHEDVKNLHIKIFKNPQNKIVAGNVDIESIKVRVNNKKSEVIIDKLPADKTFNIFLTLNKPKGL